MRKYAVKVLENAQNVEKVLECVLKVDEVCAKGPFK